MDKKLFGIKLSTYINFFICFVIAFIVWVVAKYIELYVVLGDSGGKGRISAMYGADFNQL